jgi:dehydrogenase/reductase SDR family protein 12
MDIPAAIDTFLDRTIALGYGDVGVRIRRRLSSWPADPPRIDGKVALVTGAASGIGLAASRGFAGLGARVVAVARDERRSTQAADLIREAVPGADVCPIGCDIASIDALRSLASHVTVSEQRLDVLVNNAGVMPDRHERSPDGHELMFATHVLAPFALTAWLSGLLERSAPARVINVSSGGMYWQSLPAADLQSERDRYSPKKFYARTKREQVVITELWADVLRDRGVVVHAMHPGWVDTKGVREWLPIFRTLTTPIIRAPEEGADTVVWLGAAPQALECTGRFWHDRRPRPTHYLFGASQDAPAERRRLWETCESPIKS